jgi:tetratricopeptide (TPR) repeat protein
LNYLRQKREEGKIEDTLDELCKKYQLKDDFKEELKKLLKEYYTKPMEFIEKLDSLLGKFDAPITAEKFIKEIFVNLTIKLANRYKDYIATITQFIIFEELEKLSEEYSELKQILDEYKFRRLGFEIYSLDNVDKMISVDESIKYIKRSEDDALQSAIKSKDFIIIKGPPGSGKTRMLKEALPNSGFNNFVWIEKFYDYNRHADILCAELDKRDNFIIVWDDLHYVSEQDNIRKTLEQIDKFAKKYNKRFKFIGCSRSDIYLGPDIKPEVIKLERFTNVKLVEFCAEYYKVKLDGVSPDEILEKSDGTPLYIISLFARFKDQGKIGRSDLERLPNRVIELWQDYMRYLKNKKILTFGHIDALRSIALLSHASPYSTKKEIQEVFNKVFNSQGNVDHYLQDLCNLSLVTRLEIDGYKYYMHDAHAEAVESLEECILDKDIVEKFVKIIADINKLRAIHDWMIGKFKTARSYAEYLLIIVNKILELDNSDTTAWNNKGLVYSEMKEYNEALECYNKALEINSFDAGAWNNKGNVYYKMKEYDEAIKCFMITLSLFIINQEHIELIPELLNFIIENSKDEGIKAEARAIEITLLYLNKYLPKEEYIKELNNLKKTPRIEVLIDAIINKKDTPMEIKDVVDEAFDLLKKLVLRST